MAQTFNPALQNVYAIGTSNYGLLNAKTSKQAVQEKNEVISELDSMEAMRGTNYIGDSSSNYLKSVCTGGYFWSEKNKRLECKGWTTVEDTTANYGGSCYDCGSSGYDIPLVNAKEGENKWVNWAILALAIIGAFTFIGFVMGKKSSK